jgi:hypothetical protein
MTKQLEKAIEKLRKLPDDEQNRFAEIVLDEISWQGVFEHSQDHLDKVGDSVLKEIQSGGFKKIDC